MAKHNIGFVFSKTQVVNVVLLLDKYLWMGVGDVSNHYDDRDTEGITPIYVESLNAAAGPGGEDPKSFLVGEANY